MDPEWVTLARKDEEAASAMFALVFAEKLWPKMFRANTAEEQLAAFRQAFIETIAPGVDLRTAVESLKSNPLRPVANAAGLRARAREQLVVAIERNGGLYRSAFPKASRAFAALCAEDQAALVDEMLESGAFTFDGKKAVRRSTEE